MKVSVSLFGEYRRYAPEPEFEMELADGATAAEIARKLDIPVSPSLWVLIDGKREPLERRVKAGSKVFLFQPVGGG